MNQESTSAVKQHVIDALLQVLEQGDDAHRCCAVQALGKMADPRVIPVLMDHVQDSDLDVALDSIEALGNFEDPTSLPLLREGFTLADVPEIKVNAIEAIGRFGGEEVVDELIQALRVDFDMVDGSGWDASWDINRIAVESLGRIGEPRAVADLASMLDDDEVVVDEGNILSALVGCQKQGIAVVTARLREHKMARSRRRAALALAAADSAIAKEALAEAMLDDDADVRLYAARSLAGFHDKAYLLPMFMLLKDQHPEVRVEAVQLVANLGGARATERILSLLADDNNRVRAAAANALGELGGIKAVDALLELLKSPDVDVRTSAVVALGRIGDIRANGALCFMLADHEEHEKVRIAIPSALVAMADEAVIAALRNTVGDENRVLRSVTMMALRDIGTESAKCVLLAALQGELLPPPVVSPDQGLDTAVNEATVPDDGSEAAPEQSDTTTTEDAVEQGPMSTLESIARTNQEATTTNSESSEEDVEEELPDNVKEFVGIADKNWQQIQSFKVKIPAPHLDVRHFAARALAVFSSTDVVEALCSCIAEEDPDLQLDAVNALGSIGDERAFSQLIPLLDGASEGLRFATTRAISAMTNAQARQILINKLDDGDHFVRLAAAEGLGQYQDDEVRLALRDRLLADKELGIRLACAKSLVANNNEQDVDVLVQAAFLDGGEQRLEMGALLRKFYPERASEQFIAVLNDPEQAYFHRVAIEALQEIHAPNIAD